MVAGQVRALVWEVANTSFEGGGTVAFWAMFWKVADTGTLGGGMVAVGDRVQGELWGWMAAGIGWVEGGERVHGELSDRSGS